MNVASTETWKTLLAHALDLIDSVSASGAGAFVDWTFGGGTLMLRHRHRVRRDIDIFVPDPQHLGYLSPHLNEVAASKSARYSEQANALRFFFDDGEIDFIVAPPLTDDAYERIDLLGRPVRLETSAEIVAKKVWYRGTLLKARDLFDIALIIDREAGRLAVATGYFVERRAVMLERMALDEARLRAEFALLDVLDYRPTYDHCVAILNEFLLALRRLA